MNLSTQLRIILLLVGAAIWLAIYLYGKRKAQRSAIAPAMTEPAQAQEAPPGFTPAEDLAEDEFETPAYMRRQGQREPRQDYEPRIASAHDYVDMDEVRDDDRQFVDSVEPEPIEAAVDEPVVATEASGRREPTVTFDEFVLADNPVTGYQEADPVVRDEPARVIAAEPPTPPDIPVVEHPVDPAVHGYTSRTEPVSGSVSNAAPTLSDAVPVAAERVATRTAPATVQNTATPAPAAGKTTGNAARRKIIALRVPMPERVPGAQLLALLQSERLQHGKFSIFHRMQGAGTVFSVASMVEPGMFDPRAMGDQQFPGVTIFMLLPGPLDGLVAWDQMLSCAQRIAHATGGVLQDERGGKLTPQTMEKLRDEVLDFQHLVGGMVTAN